MLKLRTMTCALLGLFTFRVFAAIPGTAWDGKSELFLNGQLFCSTDAAKKPTIAMSDREHHWFSVHRGGLGWIWPSASGGCALGWLTGYMQVQAVGGDLFDQTGAKVGSIRDDRIEAAHFTGSDADIRILKFEMVRTGERSATVRVQFRHRLQPGIFEYVGRFALWRDDWF